MNVRLLPATRPGVSPSNRQGRPPDSSRCLVSPILHRDLVHTWWALGRSPFYATLVTLMLGVMIGAATALFAIVDGIVWRPLPLPEPGRVVMVWETAVREGYPKFRVAPGNFADWAAAQRVFTRIALVGAGTWQASGDDEPEQLMGAAAGPGYFEVLGAAPTLGRTFVDGDYTPDAEPVVILSEGVWKRRFGGHAEVLGRTLVLDGRPHTVVGVMPRGVYPTWPQTTGGLNVLPAYQAVWTPLRMTSDLAATRRAHVFAVVGRLRPGVGLDDAQRGMDEIAARLAAAFPETNEGAGVLVTPLADDVAGDVRPLLLVLLGAVGLALVATCANVANMAVLRAEARRHELAVRAALGAGRAQVVRLVFLEAATLAALGGGLGLILAWAGLDVLLALAPREMPRVDDVAIGGRAALAGAALALGAAVLIGAVPFRQTWRTGAVESLRGAGRRAGAPAARPVRRALMAVELATAVVLVAGALLAWRGVSTLRATETGFDSAGVLSFELALPPPVSRDPDGVERFQTALLERLRSLPGVTAAGVGYDLPLETTWVDAYTIEGRPVAADDESPSAVLKLASPGYFSALGLERVRGRVFTDDDGAGRGGVAVVNEAFARSAFGGDDPIGQRLHVGTAARFYGGARPSTFEVVGVVKDVRARGLDQAPPPAFYLPARQFPQAVMSVFVKTAGQVRAMADIVGRTVGELDATLPVVNLQPLDVHVAAGLAGPRFLLTVLAAFAVAALWLAALGVYGLLAFAVAQRRGELAIRSALGATRPRLVSLVVAEGAVMGALGVAAGLIAAGLLGRLAASAFHEVADIDALALLTGGALTLTVAVAAGALPAWGAADVDPARLLREE